MHAMQPHSRATPLLASAHCTLDVRPCDHLFNHAPGALLARPQHMHAMQPRSRATPLPPCMLNMHSNSPWGTCAASWSTVAATGDAAGSRARQSPGGAQRRQVPLSAARSSATTLRAFLALS